MRHRWKIYNQPRIHVVIFTIYTYAEASSVGLLVRVRRNYQTELPRAAGFSSLSELQSKDLYGTLKQQQGTTRAAGCWR